MFLFTCVYILLTAGGIRRSDTDADDGCGSVADENMAQRPTLYRWDGRTHRPTGAGTRVAQLVRTVNIYIVTLHGILRRWSFMYGGRTMSLAELMKGNRIPKEKKH